MTVLAQAALPIGVLLPPVLGRSLRCPGTTITTIHRIRITQSHRQGGSGAAHLGDSAAGLG